MDGFKRIRSNAVETDHLPDVEGITGGSLKPGGSTMQADVLFRIFKSVSWAVIALMILGIAYAAFTSVKYWAGIGV